MPPPHDVYVAWGDPRIPERVTAYRAVVDPAAIRLTANNTFATVDIGPAPVTGPVMHYDVSDSSAPVVVLLGDNQVPAWASDEFLTEWGWKRAETLPGGPCGMFETDVLLLSPDGTGTFDGWSASVWLDAEMMPLQRGHLPFASLPDGLPIHVLETGSDMHGVSYLVAFCPQRLLVDSVHLAAHGWRREPGVRVRRQDWVNMAALSMNAEILVESMSYGPLIVGAVLHGPVDMTSSSVTQLPDSVRQPLAAHVPGGQRRDIN